MRSRVRTRTYGSVGGRGLRAPSYPIAGGRGEKEKDFQVKAVLYSDKLI